MRVEGASKVLGKKDRQLEAAAARLLGVSDSEFSGQEKAEQDLYDYQGGTCYEVTAALCEESLERKSVVCPQAAARLKKLAEV